jgi:hypothetical protein
VLVNGNQDKTAFRTEFPLASQQILGPKFNLDRERSSSRPDDAAHNFGELPLPNRHVKIDAFGAGRHDWPPRVS